ncbi:hypothetical protein HK096_002448 [Nowakowskiella sp. JEL0078]|nr:hypothetical protein HK096_002448 [Nowakowskiella sp. JEL0078]
MPAQATLTANQTLTMLNQLNLMRAVYGVRPLALDQRFTGIAQKQADWQASACLLTHSGPLGESLGTRVQAATGLNNLYLGENVAAGQTTVDQVMLAWRSSVGHMRNMINPNYNVVGFAMSWNGSCRYQYFWNQDFAGV